MDKEVSGAVLEYDAGRSIVNIAGDQYVLPRDNSHPIVVGDKVAVHFTEENSTRVITKIGKWRQLADAQTEARPKK